MTARVLPFPRPTPAPADSLLEKARAALRTLQEMQAARRPVLVALPTKNTSSHDEHAGEEGARL